MNDAEKAAQQHANLQHARAVAGLHEDNQPTPHDQLERHQRYVMNNHGESVFVRIITIMGKRHFVPPSGFPFSVSSVPEAKFYPVAKPTGHVEVGYRIQIVWNREFAWCYYGRPFARLDDCLTVANDLLDQGDGARVKKCRIVNNHDVVVWENGRLVPPGATLKS